MMSKKKKTWINDIKWLVIIISIIFSFSILSVNLESGHYLNAFWGFCFVIVVLLTIIITLLLELIKVIDRKEVINMKFYNPEIHDYREKKD
jgi:hypothetical protein